jgi:hypothetical protein
MPDALRAASAEVEAPRELIDLLEARIRAAQAQVA